MEYHAYLFNDALFLCSECTKVRLSYHKNKPGTYGTGVCCFSHIHRYVCVRPILNLLLFEQDEMVSITYISEEGDFGGRREAEKHQDAVWLIADCWIANARRSHDRGVWCTLIKFTFSFVDASLCTQDEGFVLMHSQRDNGDASVDGV